MHFQPSNIRVNRSRKDEESNQVDSEPIKLHQNQPKILSMIEFFQSYVNDIPLFEETELRSKLVLYNDMLQSKDKWFLIKYTSQRTLRSRWYLVQVYQVSTS